MSVQPLTIPSFPRRPGRGWRLFYWWIFIRPADARKADLSIEAQVGVRTPGEVSAAWDEAGLRPNEVILNMLARHCRLDASKLVPNDPLDIALRCFVDDMNSVDFATDFCRVFQVELPADMSEMTVGRLHKMAATTF